MKVEDIITLKFQDANEVMLLIKEAIVEMEGQNIRQWDEVYPDYETIVTDILANTMFGFVSKGELAGIVVLDKNQSPEYSGIKWASIEGTSLVMHRLCVRPKFQGQGFAKKLLRFSEQFAIDKGYTSIILDAFKDNPSALNLYENNGYLKKGMVKFRKGEFYCYQKILSIIK